MEKEDLDKFIEISKKTGLKLYALYSYDLSSQPNSKKVRFVYCLKGRDKEQGMIKKLNGRFIVPGCFIIPIKNDKEIKEVFNFWKVQFSRTLILTH